MDWRHAALSRLGPSPRAVLLAATTAFGVAATIAILRATEVAEPRLSLPIERSAPSRPMASTSQGPVSTGTSSTTQVPPSGGVGVPDEPSSTEPPSSGYRWSRVAGVAELVDPEGGGGLNAVAEVEGQGLIAVGASSDAPLVLVSPDGLAWSRVEAAERDLDGAILRDVAVVDGRLMAVGSLRGAPAAWTSIDALQWSGVPVTDSTNQLGVGLLEGVAQSSDGSVFAVGFSPGSAGIWALEGGRFEPEASVPAPGDGQVLSDVVSTSKGVVAAGNDAEGNPIALQSTGDGNWASARLPTEDGRASVAALGEVGDVVVAVGYGSSGPRVWTSGDVETWSTTAIPTASPDRPAGLFAVAPGPGGVLAAGQRPGGPLCSSSTDGRSWSECPSEDGVETAAVRDLVAVSGGFVAVGTATSTNHETGLVIWHIEHMTRGALAR